MNIFYKLPKIRGKKEINNRLIKDRIIRDIKTILKNKKKIIIKVED